MFELDIDKMVELGKDVTLEEFDEANYFGHAVKAFVSATTTCLHQIVP